MGSPVDIGHGVTVSICYYPTKSDVPEIDPSLAGKLAGLDYWHPCRDGKEAPGFIPLDDGARGWTLGKLDPLTVSPSLLCRACGHHGFIRDGRWVPA